MDGQDCIVPRCYVRKFVTDRELIDRELMQIQSVKCAILQCLKWISGGSDHGKGAGRFEGRQRFGATQSPTWVGHSDHIPAALMDSVSRSGTSGLLVKCSVPTGFQLSEELDGSGPGVCMAGVLGRKGLCIEQLRAQL